MTTHKVQDTQVLLMCFVISIPDTVPDEQVPSIPAAQPSDVISIPSTVDPEVESKETAR